jgi:cobyrinic acid a,c-diamide synthase
VKIAVARDRAFCFYYEDNLQLLRELGAEITEFSPLANEPVPECDGLILGGGYPELYADTLEKNKIAIESVREKIEDKMPCIAECGGFMYLHESMEDSEGKPHKMAGIIKGSCFATERLQRFGYMEMSANKDNILCERDNKIRAREFHYFDSDSLGNGFTAQKGNNKWECVHTEGRLFAGFPHIHFYTDITLAENFIKSCEEYKCTKQKK